MTISKPARAPQLKTADGFSVGDRVRYTRDIRLDYAQRDIHTGECPDNDFVVRGVDVRNGKSNLLLLDSKGGFAAHDETLYFDRVSPTIRLFSVLNDVEEHRGSSARELFDYVRRSHRHDDAISFAHIADLGLRALLRVYVTMRDSEKVS